MGQKIFLGPAGSPSKSTLEGVSKVNELGLQAMEVQFTHGVRMGLGLAKQIGEEQKRHRTSLSIHAPYYINLLSEDPEKMSASKKRILDSCERGHYMNAGKIVFHPGYYRSISKEEAHNEMKKQFKEMISVIKKNKWEVELAPETTGRSSQFGTLEETLKIAEDMKTSFCIDIAHLYARNHGHINYKELFDLLEKYDHVHFQFACVEYGKGGEKKHLVLGNHPDFKEFAEYLLKSNINATIICETPLTWQDSLNMKKILQKMGHGF
jgi:deoxyribonuclease IV